MAWHIAAWDGGRLGKSLSLADIGTAATVPSTVFSSQCYKIRVGCTKQIYVRIGDGTQTAVIGDTIIGAATYDYFSVSPGQQLAFLSTSTSTGFVSITEMY